jgi:hypothetical protein
MDSFGSGYRQGEGCYEHVSGPAGSIKSEEFLE